MTGIKSDSLMGHAKDVCTNPLAPGEVWQGVRLSPLYFVCAALLGVISPSGTWAIAERYPK